MRLRPNYLIVFAIFYFSFNLLTFSQTNFKDQILAVVASDTIFVKDFLYRCEYNIRPPYCSDKTIIDKKIILNSLIAELLFAFEWKSKYDIQKDQYYSYKLQGIKEQLMREKLINDEIYMKIEIDKNEIEQEYINSKKIVHTEAVFIPESYNPKIIYDSTLSGMNFDELKSKFPGVSEKISKDVKWGNIDDVAQNEIFNQIVKKGSIIKPIKTEGGYRLIKVTGWSEEIELSPQNVNQQKETIKDKLKDFYLQKNYRQYAKNIMKGKRIDFNKKGWEIFSKIFKHIYIDDSLKLSNNEAKEYSELLNENTEKPFLKIDDEIWNIGRIVSEIKKHPLEFNDEKINEDNFRNKIQSGIAGLITDYFLTKTATQKGFDKSNIIIRETKKWQTYFEFTNERSRILKENNFRCEITIDFARAFNEILNPIFDSLKIKYDNQIKINNEVLEKLDITNIPMSAYKNKGPYKSITSPFPLITNSHKINYKPIN